MIEKFAKGILIPLLLTSIGLTGLIFYATPAAAMDIYAGHFSREGNDQTPAQTNSNNIYIKLFENQWVAMLYVPYPYAQTVKPTTITEVFKNAKNQSSGSAYLRGEFGLLSQKATIQIEKFGYIEDRIIFECGSLSPCTIKLNDGYLDLIKPGMINEHIVKFNHVID